MSTIEGPLMKVSNFQKLPDIKVESDEDTESLRAMAREARSYICSFRWCPAVQAMYLAHGTAGIVALFLVDFVSKVAGADKSLWIVIGDLPSAYLVVEHQDSPREALERYCLLMDDWINAVRRSTTLDEVFPVAAEPTSENAESLQTRIEFLRSEIIPYVGRAS